MKQPVLRAWCYRRKKRTKRKGEQWYIIYRTVLRSERTFWGNKALEKYRYRENRSFIPIKGYLYYKTGL